MLQTTHRQTEASLQIVAQPAAVVNHLYFTHGSFCSDGSIVVSSDHEGPTAFYRVSGDDWHRLATMRWNGPRADIRFRYGGLIAEDLNRLFWIDGGAIASCDLLDGSNPASIRVPASIGEVVGEPLSRRTGSDWLHFFCEEQGKTTFGRLHIPTGRMERGPCTAFLANHVQAVDVDGETFIFARESLRRNGIWYPNDSRVWIGNYRTGDIRPYYQHRAVDAQTFEHIGHEMVDHSTGTVIAARYRTSPVGAPGVIRLNGHGDADQVWAGPAWHPSVSACGRWIVTDCKPDPGVEQSDIVLIDTVTGESVVIAQSNTRGGHPCHPHPSFSPDGRCVAFIDRQPSGECRVCIADLAVPGTA